MADDKEAAPSEAPVEEANAEGAEDGGEGAPAPANERRERRERSVNNQLAALSRQRKQWQQQATAEREALQREKQQVQQQIELMRQARDGARANPEEWLRQGQIDKSTLDAFYQQRQGQQPYDNRFDAFSSEIQALKSALAERDRKAEALEQRAAQFEESRNLDVIERQVKAGGDAFELINHYESYADVAEMQKLFHEQTGNRLSVKEAAERIENVLVQMREDEVKKALASPKLAKRLGWEPNNSATPDDAEADEVSAKAEKQPPQKRGKVKTKPRPDTRGAKHTNPEEIWAETMRRVNGKGPSI